MDKVPIQDLSWRWLIIGVCLVVICVAAFAAGRITACSAANGTSVGMRCYNITHLGTCKMGDKEYVVPTNITWQYKGVQDGSP